MKKRLLALLLCGCLLAMTGCGGGSSTSEPAPSESAGGSAETNTTNTGTAGDRWININASLPLNYDPAIGSSSADSSIQFNVYDTVLFTEIDGTVIPNVATEWFSSDGGMKWTFKIREGITFHDGSALEASDVAFSINRTVTIGQGFAYLWVDFVDRAEAVDSTTVEVTMKQPYAVFPATLVRMAVVNEDLVMANIDKSDTTYGGLGDYGTNWLSTNDAGSGPFMTKEISPTDYVTCERYDDYWQGFGTNPPDGFTVRAINEGATILTMMSNGELSITDEWETQDTYEALDAIEGVELAKIGSGAIMCMEMNTQKAPMDDVHVRKAMAYLFDYDTATNYIYPGTKKAGGPVSSAYKGSIADELNTYSFDIEKAKEELAQSKYADTIGDYTIDIQYSADVKDEEDLCLLLQQAGSQLGMNITITSTPFATLISNAASPETTACITVMAPSDSYSEAGSVLKLHYHSSTAGTFTQFEWLLDDELDKMIEAALSESDEAARMAKYAEAQKYIDDLCPTIWTLEWPEERAYRADLFTWPEGEAENNAPIMGRCLYLRTIEFKN